MTLKIYGIKSCSTMKKAFTKLDELNVPYDFHDYKKQGIDKTSVQRWVDKLGVDKVLNKRGTTWRKLSDDDKQAANDNIEAAIELLVNHTSMIKRPIIEGQLDNDDIDSNTNTHTHAHILLCGFDADELDAVLGS